MTIANYRKRILILPLCVAVVLATGFESLLLAGSPGISTSHFLQRSQVPAPIFIPKDTNTLALIPARNVQSTNLWKPDGVLRKWKFIVLHHTATATGSVATIHKQHLQRVDSNGNPWRGIGYHFVIGNGQGMKDGKIEQTFRWVDQTEGAHAGVATYNDAGIGVCLIGNFDKTKPTAKQLASLKKLVGVMKQEYAIEVKHVVAHKNVKATRCPGKFFPVNLFAKPISNQPN